MYGAARLILCGVLCETGWQGKKTHTFSCGIELWSSLVVEHSSNLNEVQGSNLSDL
jgi:hypothetical protein